MAYTKVWRVIEVWHLAGKEATWVGCHCPLCDYFFLRLGRPPSVLAIDLFASGVAGGGKGGMSGTRRKSSLGGKVLALVFLRLGMAAKALSDSD